MNTPSELLRIVAECAHEDGWFNLADKLNKAADKLAVQSARNAGVVECADVWHRAAPSFGDTCPSCGTACAAPAPAATTAQGRHWNCPSCWFDENVQADARECPGCGVKIPETTGPAQPVSADGPVNRCNVCGGVPTISFTDNGGWRCQFHPAPDASQGKAPSMEDRAEDFLQRAIPDADGALLEVLAAEFQAIHDEASTPASPPAQVGPVMTASEAIGEINARQRRGERTDDLKTTPPESGLRHGGGDAFVPLWDIDVGGPHRNGAQVRVWLPDGHYVGGKLQPSQPVTTVGVTVEQIAAAIEPALFSDDHETSHRAASPWSVESARVTVLNKAARVLTRLQSTGAKS